MKTDTTKAAAEAAEGALFLGDDGSILWKPDPHAQLHFWRTGVIQAACEQMTAPTHPLLKLGSEFAMTGVDSIHAARRAESLSR